MNRRHFSLRMGLAATMLGLGALALAVTLSAPSTTAPDDNQLLQQARPGLALLMDGDLNGAIETFRRIQTADPESPLGYLLEADAVWWRIYYATANLIDPDVFTATDLPTTSSDARFEYLVKTTIDKSEARIRAREAVARNLFYQGMAYALRGRLAGLRDKDLATARAGKKMRSLLLKAVELDPNLTDAYLGIGTYNYFVDTLSMIVKIIRFFIGLPGGSREVGLQQLELVAQKGDLARAEAKFYLAKDYSRSNERQYARSLKLFEELAQEYPHNPLWPMLTGSLHFRMGQPQQGEAMYWQVYKKTKGENSEVKQALHRASRLALQRLHPDQRFE